MNGVFSFKTFFYQSHPQSQNNVFLNHKIDNSRVTQFSLPIDYIDDEDYEKDNINLADDEPLSSRFQRAVVLQRAGDHMSALNEYQIFVKAAEQCDVSPAMYAEVLINMGAIYFSKLKDKQKARQQFETALTYRDIGSAHVNLALLTLSESQFQSSNPNTGVNIAEDALLTARDHCTQAIQLNDNINTVNGATRLLNDIEAMLQNTQSQSKD